MDTKRVLYLINMLKDGSVDRQEQLAQLYDRALEESDEYQQLSGILNNYAFMGSSGAGIRDRGNELIYRMAEEPDNIVQIMKETEQLIELVRSEIKHNEKLISYPGAFTGDINIVPKTKLDAYNKFLNNIAAVCTYIIAVQNGNEGISGLYWSDNYNFSEKLTKINTSYIPALLQLDGIQNPWMIYRRPARSNYLFCPYEYVLRYITSGEFSKWTLADEYVEISPFLYGSPRRAANIDLGIPIYLGIGNIVSTSPLDSLRLLATGVGAKISHPNEKHFVKKVPYIMTMVSQLTSGVPCIVSPEEIVSTMNQWDAGYTINDNIRNHKCLICGEKLLGNDQICRIHLKMRRL